MEGEILKEMNPREAADRDRGNTCARLSDSQREKDPKTEQGVQRKKQFDRSAP